MDSFKKFIDDLKNPGWVLSDLSYMGKTFSYPREKLDKFKTRYFHNISCKTDFEVIIPEEEDFDDLVFLLRGYYKLWIEILASYWISISAIFPNRFELIKDINFNIQLGKSIQIGSTLFYHEELNVETNRLKGLKLTQWKGDNMEDSEISLFPYDSIEPIFDNLKLYV